MAGRRGGQGQGRGERSAGRSVRVICYVIEPALLTLDSTLSVMSWRRHSHRFNDRKFGACDKFGPTCDIFSQVT